MYEDLKLEKSTDNPEIRWKDPDSWKCLTNEQRDIICEWYYDLLVEKEKRKKRENNIHQNAMYFAITPFAFAYGIMYTTVNDWRILLYFLCSFIIYSFIATIFYEGYISYMNFNPPESKFEYIWKTVCSLLISFFVTYAVLLQTGYIYTE